MLGLRELLAFVLLYQLLVLSVCMWSVEALGRWTAFLALSFSLLGIAAWVSLTWATVIYHSRWRIYYAGSDGIRCVFKHVVTYCWMMAALVVYLITSVGHTVSRLGHWAWSKTTAGRIDQHIRQTGPTKDNLPFVEGGLGKASWRIIDETVRACRAQLGLDRYSSHKDIATRQLVKKTCFGILTDKTRFPDLRLVDADRLCPLVAEMALSPTSDEIEALNIASSAPFARNRFLAYGAWERQPTTWLQWVLVHLRIRDRVAYLPAVTPPDF